VPKTKRIPAGPKAGFEIVPESMETIAAIPYDIIKEGLV
jgi:large subunit ribosomal protein L21e